VSGVIEPGEGAVEAAAREVAEETDLKIVVGDIVQTGLMFPALSPGSRRPLRIQVLTAFLRPSFCSRAVHLQEELNEFRILEVANAKKLLTLRGTREGLCGLEFFMNARNVGTGQPVFLNRSE